MLHSESVWWNALQTIRLHLADRRMTSFRRDVLDDRRPDKSRNEADFLEVDLRYIFTMPYVIHHLSEFEYHEMQQNALDLLTSLEGMVNKDIIELFDDGGTNPYDIPVLGIDFPRLSALLHKVCNSPLEQFSFINRPDIPLFTLPQGEARSLAITRVSHWKKFLMSSITNAQNLQTPRFPDFGRRENAMFREFRYGKCDEVHDIKLEVPNQSRLVGYQPVQEMFVSSGPTGDFWLETQCRRFQSSLHTDDERSLCTAIEHAIAQNRKLYLSLGDGEVLHDISHQLPPKSSSSGNFIVESLDELLERKVFTQITPRDYLEGTINAKMSSQEKAVLALRLARCLMDFIDGEADLVSSGWKPQMIDFIRSSRTDANDRRLYIRLKPYITNQKRAYTLKTIGPGNPILLSFAKLLLDIESGDQTPMEIYSDDRKNLANWGAMCGFVYVMEGNAYYIDAVKGCLYLHMALPKPNDEREASQPPDNEVLRKVIYEQIVKNLELVVDSGSSKPKWKDPVPSIVPRRRMISRQPTYLAPDFLRPTSRYDFHIAIICALRVEYDAVVLLCDEFWDDDLDCYGRADGDPNIYTTGRIGKVNIVLVLLSNMGKVSAASASASLRSSYPGLELVLVSGICGGVPFPAEGEELTLGGVVISRCVVQYDLGRKYPSGFMARDKVEDALGRAPRSIRNLLAILETDLARERLAKMAFLNLQHIQDKAYRKLIAFKYRYPGVCEDQLFQSDYLHKHLESCQCGCISSPCQAARNMMCRDLGCDIKHLVQRKKLEWKRELEERDHINKAQAPSIFVGRIGSADTVLKCAKERDRIAKEHGVIAFEMEGAGVWDEIPCIIVKGACDYADSHKNKLWHAFAAATAASVTKALIERYIQPTIENRGSFQ